MHISCRFLLLNCKRVEKPDSHKYVCMYIPWPFPPIQEGDQDQTVQGSRRHNTPAPRSASSLPGDKIQRRRFPILLAPSLLVAFYDTRGIRWWDSYPPTTRGLSIYIPWPYPPIQEGDRDQTGQGYRRHNTPAPSPPHLFLGIRYRGGDSPSVSLRPLQSPFTTRGEYGGGILIPHHRGTRLKYSRPNK